MNIADYLEYIRQDYRNWQGAYRSKNDTIRQEMIAEFDAGVRYEVGRKYIKVITGTSVHSFIVREDGGKFKKGDILMAATWRGPATNFARGNLIDGTINRVRWTGAM